MALSWILFLILLNTWVATGLISWDTACGVTKGCFPDCPGGCEYLVTWRRSGLTIEFSLQAEETDTDVYLAIGFSDDYRMGDDSVVGCIVPSGEVISAFNDGLHTETLSSKYLGLSSAPTSVSQTNGVITCSFTRDVTNDNEKFFNLDKEYILLLVIGEGSGTSLGIHYSIPWSSDSKVKFGSTDVVGLYKLNTPAVKLHGMVFVLSWLLLSVVGILTARYNKEMLDHKTLCGSKVWLQVHRLSMVGVLVLTLIGIISILINIEGYSQICPSKGNQFLKMHPIVGIVVTVFTVANPIGALFRPGHGHRYRALFNWVHMSLGIATQVFAVVAIIVGYNLERSMLPDSTNYVTTAILIIIAVTFIILEIHKWKQTRDRGASVNNEPTDGETRRDMEMEVKKKKKPPKSSKLPFYIMTVVGLVVFGLTIGILGIIVVS